MALILCIDTALDTASVALAENGHTLATRINHTQSDHAAWIHAAIRELCTESGTELRQLSAVAVTSGPGSYTGLRVGMATAKGLCFALEKPLITENILKLTAIRSLQESINPAQNVRLRPMIDARRMEVFTALYDSNLEQLREPGAVVLDEMSFESELAETPIVFSGNGIKKWKMMYHPNAIFVESSHSINDFAQVSFEKFVSSAFSDLAYTEPDYFKSFYTGK